MKLAERWKARLRVAADAAVLYGLWLLFAGSTALPELLVGVPAALIATGALRAVEFRRLAQLAPRLSWIARAVWLPWYLVVDTGRILAVLVRHLGGSQPAPSLLFATPYDATGDDARAATRRAIATAYTSMTPNSIVLDIDTSRGLLFFHQLRESATSRMTRALGAEA